MLSVQRENKSPTEEPQILMPEQKKIRVITSANQKKILTIISEPLLGTQRQGLFPYLFQYDALHFPDS